MAAAASSSSAMALAADEPSTAPLFDDMFDVIKVNPEGKKFDKVSRLVCQATTLDVSMIVDIASEVYSVAKGDRFTLNVVSSLRLDGRKDDDAFDQTGRETLLDQFDYGMHGRVFQYDVKDDKAIIMVSFGGLLMRLAGPREHLAPIELNATVYALFRKTKGTSA